MNKKQTILEKQQKIMTEIEQSSCYSLQDILSRTAQRRLNWQGGDFFRLNLAVKNFFFNFSPKDLAI